jgi:hypothetical protein
MPNNQVIALQLEKVRDKVPLLYERSDKILQMIQQRGDVEKVSTRFMRLPLQTNPGGKAGMYNADGGDLGRGTMTTYDFAQVTPMSFKFAVEITHLVEIATNAKEKAVEDAAKREVANGMKQFRMFLDALMYTPGNGVLATVSGAPVGTVVTTAVPPGASLFYVGQTILFWDSTGTVFRGAANVVQSDPIVNFTVTVDVLPAGVVSGDQITHDGITGAVTTQSSLFGIPYHQSNATTGIWLNLNRATYATQLQTPRVNAANSALVPQFVRQAMQKVRLALGEDALGKLTATLHPAQETAWENIGTTISQVILNQVNAQPNPLPGMPKMMGDATIKTSIHAQQTRIDFLDLTHWGRAIMEDIDFYDVNGQTMFQIYGASGGVAAAYDFYYVTSFQVWNDSPRSGAFIDTLARPSGF